MCRRWGTKILLLREAKDGLKIGLRPCALLRAEASVGNSEDARFPIEHAVAWYIRNSACGKADKEDSTSERQEAHRRFERIAPNRIENNVYASAAG